MRRNVLALLLLACIGCGKGPPSDDHPERPPVPRRSSGTGGASERPDGGEATERPETPEDQKTEGRDPSTLLFESGETLDGHLTWPLPEPIAGDTDGDGLSDEEEAKEETDKDKPDTDFDGLLDGWEVKGVDGTNLKALGANPRRKDVFVEMDYMERDTATNGLGPSAEVLDTLRAAFANAPVKNHDGSDGISLHLDLDDKLDHVAVLGVGGFYDLKKTEFNIGARGRCFHYMIWCDEWAERNKDDQPISGQSMNIPASDFVVSLGPWNESKGGDNAEKIGTFLHELGHNLGLHHSDEEMNESPNHLSVMSYRFQMTGPKKGKSFIWTYQWLALPALDEAHLNEAVGLGLDPELAGWQTAWYGPDGNLKEAPADGPINWDCDTDTEEAAVIVNLNKDSNPAGILVATIDEWGGLAFRGGTIGSGLSQAELRKKALAVPERLPVEHLSEERAARLRKQLGFR